CRAMPGGCDLQRAADEEVAGILASGLGEGTVGAEIAVGAYRKHVRAICDVAFHAEFGAEAVDAVDEAGFDRGDQGRMRVEHEVPGDLALQSALRGEGRQDQFDRRRGIANAVVETPHLARLVYGRDTSYRHLPF